MIVDELRNAALYGGLPEALVRGLHFLRDSDVAALAPGRHAIDGDRIFALVQDYMTRPVAACRWEAHRCYCDVQFVAKGEERIGVGPLSRMRVVEAHDEAKDVVFLDGDGDFVTLRAGTFAILWPHDAHMPCVAVAAPVAVRKIVVKVGVEAPR